MNNSKYTRRAVLRGLGVIGLGAALAPTPAMAVMRVADAVRMADRRYKVSETRFMMGTFVSITAVHQSRTLAEEAMGRAYGEIERLSAILDRHATGTQIAHLNATGTLRDAAPELVDVLAGALDSNRLSAGAYDATVLPVVALLRDHANPSGRMDLTRAEIREALALVDSSAVSLEGRDIRLEKTGMGITLDGIGKGYIVDRASDVLAACGVTDHLVNAGGDMRARGERAPGKAWTVAIEDPAGKGNYPAVIALRNAAVATSAGYEASFDSKGAHHHVVDPRTAMSPTRSVSVSVVAPTVMQADALSTAAFVMPPKDGVRLLDSLAGCEGMILGNTGVHVTSGNWSRITAS